MNQVIIKVIGNYSYQTSRCLGEGVYGKVYEGMQRQSKEKVAIKKIDLATFTNDKYLENAIFSQIYLLKRFNHPNIVRFKDVLSSKNSLYIITEFCKNGDLKELVKRKRFKQQQAFQIMRQILSGFTELVREKIIHRDLKPANILIHEGVYKIGDFGFAKYVDNFGSQMLKSCVGSPIYMAPQILQRTPYTTKCDIWSLGIIFYQMIHGYPPWKARDEGELLRGIKNITIGQVLKRSTLTSKGNDFLKKTLAYSEEERIGWTELFQKYCPKQEKLYQSSQNNHTQSSSTKEKEKQRERNRVISANSTNNLAPWNTNNLGNGRTNLTPMNSGNINRANSRSNLNTNTYSPDKRRNLFPAESQKKSVNNYHSSAGQLQSIKIWRQFCVYYHFYCIQLTLNFNYIGGITNKSQPFAKLILSLAMLIKNRSTYCLSLISSHTKGSNKSIEDLQKKMQQQHESYEQAFSDITSLLEKVGLFKNLRSEMTGTIGHGQVINQERIDKLENLMLGVANENAHILSEQVRKRAKSLKQFTLVEVLDNVMDILALGLGKSKTLKEMSEENKNEEQDLKDYVTKVITKVDRLTSNM